MAAWAARPPGWLRQKLLRQPARHPEPDSQPAALPPRLPPGSGYVGCVAAALILFAILEFPLHYLVHLFAFFDAK